MEALKDEWQRMVKRCSGITAAVRAGIDVVVRPTHCFATLSRCPHPMFPIMLYTLSASFLAFVLAPSLTPVIHSRFASAFPDTLNLLPLLEQTALVIIIIGVAVVAALSMMIGALILLVLSRIFVISIDPDVGVSVFGYSHVPLVIRNLLLLWLSLVHAPLASTLLSGKNPLLFTMVVGRLSMFTIWSMALLTWGWRRSARTNQRRATGLALVFGVVNWGLLSFSPPSLAVS